MPIRTLWTIFIKILGISLVLSGLAIIPQFLTALPLFGQTTNDIDGIFQGVGLLLLFLLLTIALYSLVLWLFVFKPAWLIDKLHLNKGFTEEKIELNVKQSTVLTVAVIVVGGLVFVDSFPMLCRQIFVFIQTKSMFIENSNSGWIIFHLVKTMIGYLLMTNSKLVVKFIEKETEKEIGNENGL